jgi:hypothetical protein
MHDRVWEGDDHVALRGYVVLLMVPGFWSKAPSDAGTEYQHTGYR